ncbi:hypothetical protein I6N96_19215 [Enterococcus sp. BWM-S5]|uniref:Uncharacterized protein n=1 Tax=Enterococcus larvae TaxID=2794352 RepID=A0ABS4CQQ6_9ENTE|nr:hypothetical protein [Enterococcus larvae]MBP1048415.1 hypothetical protein [Enterococcus larvae]
MIEQIKQLLDGSRIKEIYLVWVMDTEAGLLEFYPDLRFLYLEFATGIIECRSVEQYSRLKLSLVDSVRYDFEIDEDMFRATSRAGELILDNPDLLTNEITSLTFYDVKESEKEVHCLALEMQLKSGQFIFIDPTFLHGIGIGGYNQKKLWRENLPEGLEVKAKRVALS